MDIVNKIVRWFFQKELVEEKNKYQLELDNLKNEKEDLEISNGNLKKLAFGTHKILISQTMLKCISEMLPDPNKVGTGSITSSELNLRAMNFVDEFRGQKRQHSIQFVKVVGEDENIQGLTIYISDYDLNIFIPLRKESFNCEVHGVSSVIYTYFWDFYRTDIRMVSDEAWENIIDFIMAQNDIMKEF